MKAVEIFIDTMKWLRNNYERHPFFLERDIVWTVQLKLLELIKEHNLPYQVHNDYPILPGTRRSLSTDLAILNAKTNTVDLVIEFKFEPSHRRNDIIPGKFPVVSWSGVKQDIDRIQEFITQGKAKMGYSILIDEGGYFRHREPHPNSSWTDWIFSNSNQKVSVLFFVVHRDSQLVLESDF